MGIETFAIIGLAVWRVSSLLVNEDGPWDLLRLFRLHVIGIKEIPPSQGGGVFIPNGFWGGFFSCVWCASLWLAPLFLGAWFLWPAPTYWTCVVLALSSFVIWFEGQTHRH